MDTSPLSPLSISSIDVARHVRAEKEVPIHADRMDIFLGLNRSVRGCLNDLQGARSQDERDFFVSELREIRLIRRVWIVRNHLVPRLIRELRSDDTDKHKMALLALARLRGKARQALPAVHSLLRRSTDNSVKRLADKAYKAIALTFRN